MKAGKFSGFEERAELVASQLTQIIYFYTRNYTRVLQGKWSMSTYDMLLLASYPILPIDCHALF